MLLNVNNTSSMTVCFPSFLKIAQFTQIFKTMYPNDVNNCRPINLLQMSGRRFEIFSFNYIYYFFNYFSLLNPCQFGFHKKMSTFVAVTVCSQYIYESMADGYFVVSSFLDYAEAFDWVDLSMLIWKMYAFGVRGQTSKWFQTQSLAKIKVYS